MIEDQNVTINGRSKRASLRRRRSKGRTIRKVMGEGGEGNFRAAGIFFRYQIPCMNFS